MPARALQRAVLASHPLTKQWKVPRQGIGGRKQQKQPQQLMVEEIKKSDKQQTRDVKVRSREAVSEARRDALYEFGAKQAMGSPRKQWVEQMNLHSPLSISPRTLLCFNPEPFKKPAGLVHSWNNGSIYPNVDLLCSGLLATYMMDSGKKKRSPHPRQTRLRKCESKKTQE